jgi:hypothetical protein
MRFKSVHALGKQKSLTNQLIDDPNHLSQKPLMTDGGDIPHGMDGEENVGGISRSKKISTPLVPMIEDVDDDSPVKQA